MPGLAATTANAFLNALCRGTPYSNSEVWIKLHTGDPGASGNSNPATETTRKQITFGSGASGGAISNTAQVQWTNIAATGTEDATHYSLWTSSTGGVFLGSGTITLNPYTSGDTVTIAVGDLDLSLQVAS